MQEVQKEFNNTIEIKKSKFITHICPYSEFKNTMTKLKQNHPKARHFVYAYRFLNEFEQIVENSSDDGEPKGTSAKPSLAVLSGANVINTAVIIVRYFGGTKLGTGGLVRAYTQAVNDICNISVFNKYEKLIVEKIEIPYKNLSKIQYILTKLKINIIKKEFSSNIILTVKTTKEKLNIYYQTTSYT